MCYSDFQRRLVFLAIRHCTAQKADENNYLGNLRRNLKNDTDPQKISQYIFSYSSKYEKIHLVSSPARRCLLTAAEIAYGLCNLNFRVSEGLIGTNKIRNELDEELKIIHKENRENFSVLGILVTHNSTISFMHELLMIKLNLGNTMLPGEVIGFFVDQFGQYSSESLYYLH